MTKANLSLDISRQFAAAWEKLRQWARHYCIKGRHRRLHFTCCKQCNKIIKSQAIHGSWLKTSQMQTNYSEQHFSCYSQSSKVQVHTLFDITLSEELSLGLCHRYSQWYFKILTGQEVHQRTQFIFMIKTHTLKLTRIHHSWLTACSGPRTLPSDTFKTICNSFKSLH